MISTQALQFALDTQKTVNVKFRTKRDTIRKMRCSRIPVDVDYTGKSDYRLNGPDIICVYDYQNSAWRAFRKDSVIEWSVT